jgi:hypothetical protein
MDEPILRLTREGLRLTLSQYVRHRNIYVQSGRALDTRVRSREAFEALEELLGDIMNNGNIPND